MSSSDESSEEEATADPVSQELLLDELSADTLAALQSHLQREQESSSDDEEEDGGAGVSEDFGLSQFWVRPPRPADPRADNTRAVCPAPPGAARLSPPPSLQLAPSPPAVRRRHGATACRGGD